MKQTVLRRMNTVKTEKNKADTFVFPSQGYLPKCTCVIIPYFLNARLHLSVYVGASAGVTQKESTLNFSLFLLVLYLASEVLAS